TKMRPGGSAGEGCSGVISDGAPPLPIDRHEPPLQAHGCSATYAARRFEGPGAIGCPSSRDSTRDASPARAAALTTSRANRERITPNRSTWRGWVRIANTIAWENIARPSCLGAPLWASDSLSLRRQVRARDVRRRGGGGAARTWLCQAGEPAPPVTRA